MCLDQTVFPRIEPRRRKKDDEDNGGELLELERQRRRRRRKIGAVVILVIKPGRVLKKRKGTGQEFGAVRTNRRHSLVMDGSSLQSFQATMLTEVRSYFETDNADEEGHGTAPSTPQSPSRRMSTGTSGSSAGSDLPVWGQTKASDDAKRRSGGGGTYIETEESTRHRAAGAHREKKTGLDRGNRLLYSDINLLKRDMIRFDPGVIEVLSYFWKVADEDGNGAVDEQEYTHIHRRLYRCLVPLVDRFAQSKTQEKKMANDDWVMDCQGYDTLNHNRFNLCFFQLADKWTDEVDAEEYATFLWRVLIGMTKIRRVRRPSQENATEAADAAAALKRKQTIRKVRTMGGVDLSSAIRSKKLAKKSANQRSVNSAGDVRSKIQARLSPGKRAKSKSRFSNKRASEHINPEDLAKQLKKDKKSRKEMEEAAERNELRRAAAMAKERAEISTTGGAAAALAIHEKSQHALASPKKPADVLEYDYSLIFRKYSQVLHYSKISDDQVWQVRKVFGLCESSDEEDSSSSEEESSSEESST